MPHTEKNIPRKIKKLNFGKLAQLGKYMQCNQGGMHFLKILRIAVHVVIPGPGRRRQKNSCSLITSKFAYTVSSRPMRDTVSVSRVGVA